MFLQPAKKDKERRFVEILAKELDAFPPGKLIDSESPDFLVATSEGVIGIEVTKIHHANEPRQQESECRSLVDAACRLYENESTIPLRFISASARNSTSETETNSRESWRT